MKLSTQAACLSAFLFPGSGHVLLKCYIRASIFIVIAAIGLFLFMEATFTIAWEIANDIETGNVQFDILAIRNLITQSLTVYDQPQLTGAKYAIIGSWLFSSIDAWRIAYRLERNAQSTS